MRFTVLVILLLFAIQVFSFDENYIQCEKTVRNWAESSIENVKREDNKLTLRDLLFFLHIPRTGGRTYFHCFLRKLYSTSLECPRSYDKLRFDPSKPKCKLVVSHDDYSLTTKLPTQQTSVVTILRDPVERIFSTYEFSVEVAARFLVHSNLTSAMEMSSRIRPKSKGVSTLDIWPWKYLVPWIRQDLFTRRDERRLGKLRRNANNDAYNMEDMVMPLHQFINDPISHEIIHNGATFQVAGLTNNSFLSEAQEVRHCVRKYTELGHFVLEIAKGRLDQMLYVGLTEDHKKSAKMFASMVGAQVLSNSKIFPSDSNNKMETSIQDSTTEDSNHTSIEDEVSSPPDSTSQKGNMTVGKLMEKYEKCTGSLRKSQSSRRTMSLKRISPINYSKQARRSVSESIIEEIRTLNYLDIELYKHAQSIFSQQQNLMFKYDQLELLLAEQEMKNTCNRWYGCSLWNLAVFALMILIMIVSIFLIVTLQKRTAKLKV
ncbi:hypothetical protein LUZ60_002197 [Juncus effusus]|nr:hypothetical protein LUZ60_002197 [Juncus effusus]